MAPLLVVNTNGKILYRLMEIPGPRPTSIPPVWISACPWDTLSGVTKIDKQLDNSLLYLSNVRIVYTDNFNQKNAVKQFLMP